jgi:molecular chaperone GrpE
VHEQDEEIVSELAEQEGTPTEDATVRASGNPGAPMDESTEPPLDPLASALAEAAQLKDKLLRTAADFDNFRKRTRREVDDARRHGRDGLLKDLLPVFDNLERAVEHALKSSSGEADWKGLAEGMALVLRQFTDTLSRAGVDRLQAVGTPFDPALHEAIQHLETDDHPPGVVAAEVQAGYRDGDRLVRPALVVVAKAKPPANAVIADESAHETEPDTAG